jgi:hypothetical protein
VSHWADDGRLLSTLASFLLLFEFRYYCNLSSSEKICLTETNVHLRPSSKNVFVEWAHLEKHAGGHALETFFSWNKFWALQIRILQKKISTYETNITLIYDENIIKVMSQNLNVIKSVTSVWLLNQTSQCFSNSLPRRNPYNNFSYPEETLPIKTKKKKIRRRLWAHGNYSNISKRWPKILVDISMYIYNILK